jgi:2-dehydro-3-deoxy-D-arabinonate dehydratase
VPEPELGLVLDRRGDIAGYVIGNDVSSRSIEGENPLYLPQAKVYRGSCAVGPCLVPAVGAPPVADMKIRLAISRAGTPIFDESDSIAQLRRRPQDLADWLFSALDFPVGVVLLTGTSIVPEAALTLTAGDEVRIEISSLGALVNRVEVVGKPRSGL